MSANLHDPKAQKKARSRENRLIARRREVLRSVMSTPMGREFMYDLIFHRLGMNDVYPGSDSGIYRHEGKRSVAVALGSEVQIDHADHYVLMITERMAHLKLTGAPVTPDTEPENPDAS